MLEIQTLRSKNFGLVAWFAALVGAQRGLVA
jgi:hypothetical protein